MFPKPSKQKKSKPVVIKIQLQSKKECYVTGRTDGLQEHHIFYGKNRKWSDKYGLTVWLNIDYHTGQYGVHKGNTKLDAKLKHLAQRKFEAEYSRELFVQIFGRSYL